MFIYSVRNLLDDLYNTVKFYRFNLYIMMRYVLIVFPTPRTRLSKIEICWTQFYKCLAVELFPINLNHIFKLPKRKNIMGEGPHQIFRLSDDKSKFLCPSRELDSRGHKYSLQPINSFYKIISNRDTLILSIWSSI
jgi:hypothetical protein